MTKNKNKVKDHEILIERIEKQNVNDEDLKFKIIDNEDSMLFRIQYKDEATGKYKSHRYSYDKRKTKEHAYKEAQEKQRQLMTDYLTTGAA